MRYRFTTLLLSAGIATLLAGCEHLKPSNRISSPTQATVAEQQAASTQSIMNGQTTTDSVPLATLSTAKTLQNLIQQQKISELRTTYNANYGTSLLFHPETLTYYVALFQRNDFWRVVDTSDFSQAEATYQSFVNKTAELAKMDIKRIRLQAEHRFMEQQIAMRSNELNSLRSDLDIQRQHERAIAAQQQRTRQEADRLTEQQQSIQAQLRALQRQIEALEQQKNQIDAAIALEIN